MTLEQKIAWAEQQDINSFLQRLGYQPEKITAKDNWYKIRQGEQVASFHVSKATLKPGLKHICYDFGVSDFGGGTILNLAAWLTDKTLEGKQFVEVVDYVLRIMGTQKLVDAPAPIATPQKTKATPEPNRYQLKSATKITSESIITYLTQKRRLTPSVIKTYLRQVHFIDTKTGQKYFAPGIGNLAGGYEVNNNVGKKFKSAIPSSSKSLSFLAGTRRKHKKLYLFEGFLDALSYLVHDNSGRQEKLRHFPHDVLILNGAALKKHAFEFIKNGGYTTIIGFLDNDKTGNALKEEFKNEFGPAFIDFSHIYFDYTDYNAYLVSLEQQA